MMVEIIKKKRDGLDLNKEEIQSVVDGITSGDIPDYQISAFLMAVYFKNMNAEETVYLTDALLHSGEQIDLSGIEGIKVDKHSTGGVGDKTTIILGPLVAAAGVSVAKMSGRGLGHTGGTLDKLESIKGFNVTLSKEEFVEKVNKHKIAICSQSEDLVPADKRLYALRDVTGTVDNFALIISSIMSKKLACGADAIVIDLKVGHGAYMKDLHRAERLGTAMIDIGHRMGKKVVAVLSDMNQPLGYYIGNGLEIKEVIETLQGQGPRDLTELCLTLGAYMLVLAKRVDSVENGEKLLQELIENGSALAKFKEFIASQGGDLSMIENTDLLPMSGYSERYISTSSGFISELNALEIGLASVQLGAGRKNKTSKLDMGAGIRLFKKKGDYVERGETLAILYAKDHTYIERAVNCMDSAYQWSDTKPELGPIVMKIMD